MFFVTINATGYASAAFSLSQDKTTLFRIIPSLSRQNHIVQDYSISLKTKPHCSGLFHLSQDKTTKFEIIACNVS
jgi:hypothetical protein